MKQRKDAEAEYIRIVPYKEEYAEAFFKINEQWISQYFNMEDPDYKALKNPEEYILAKGGIILIALYKEVPAGTCALIPMEDPNFDFELAKMGVSQKVRGKGIGWMLGQQAILAAKRAGAKRLYLESNTVLEPALQLYQKLGFQRITGYPSPYSRCNIQMALEIT